MSPVPTTAKRREPAGDRRAQILDAALHMFVRRGVAGTQIADIRRRSGASVGSIYHHFSSKEGVAAALLLEALADYHEGALGALAGAETSRAGVEAVVRHHIAWVLADPDRARYLLMSREPAVELAVGAPLRDINRRFFAAVERWVTSHREIRRLPRDVLYALWVGPSQELTRHWLAGRTRHDPLTYAPLLARAAWRALTDQED
jgi:AcrR family transcriptional regulator